MTRIAAAFFVAAALVIATPVAAPARPLPDPIECLTSLPPPPPPPEEGHPYDPMPWDPLACLS